jgi:hypothetical protein
MLTGLDLRQDDALIGENKTPYNFLDYWGFGLCVIYYHQSPLESA